MAELHGAPNALCRLGITSVTDNLPPGASLDIARDFVRVFRAEIERKAFVRSSPDSSSAGGATCPSPAVRPNLPCL